MNTTYSVNWRAGKDATTAGTLEVTPDAVVFTPSDGGAPAEVPLADVPAVRRWSSAVELDRKGGEAVWIESTAAGALGARLEAAVELAETLRSLRAEHDRIDEELAELRVAVACLADLTDVREHEVGLLATDLMRRIVDHAHVEELELYPAVARLLGCAPLVEALVFDHRAIEGEVRDLVRVDPDDRARLACVFHRLDALVTTHIAKEESVVFPLLESR
jgi:hemerythrin-like domain-containing protein